MFCSECGKEIGDSSKFCSECGKPLSIEVSKPESQTKEKKETVGFIDEWREFYDELPQFIKIIFFIIIVFTIVIILSSIMPKGKSAYEQCLDETIVLSNRTEKLWTEYQCRQWHINGVDR